MIPPIVLVFGLAVDFVLGLVLLVLILLSENKALRRTLYCTHQTTKCVECGREFRRKGSLRGH